MVCHQPEYPAQNVFVQSAGFCGELQGSLEQGMQHMEAVLSA